MAMAMAMAMAEMGMGMDSLTDEVGADTPMAVSSATSAV